MTEFERGDTNNDSGQVTTNAIVETYNSSSAIFRSLLIEVKELSKKKPEATMSAGKVNIINRVLKDLLTFLKDEPSGKYLDQLDDEALPQVSDAVLMMVQFDSALKSFKERYHRQIGLHRYAWITEERRASSND
ncbi:MAG: hypothetical protein GY789_17475 [Hyphomicrobiales bacterium]|nr:hypothetical protein [Hyphomicrobiales bacterium]